MRQAMKEKQKMLAGLPFDRGDPEIVRERLAAADLCFDLNNTRPSDLEARRTILKKLLPHLEGRFHILSPFQCEFGNNITFGDMALINYGFRAIDCAPITFGTNAFIGPRATFNTLVSGSAVPTALPITVGNNVWFGSEVTVLAGVTIGDGTVIGAGSVVTHDIPPCVLAAGNPCEVIRTLEEDIRLGR